MFRLVKEPGTFLYTGLNAYHCSFNGGYNVAETVNFTNASWLEFERVAAIVASDNRVSHLVSFPWEFIAWKEIRRLLAVVLLGKHSQRRNGKIQEHCWEILPSSSVSRVHCFMNMSETKGGSSQTGSTQRRGFPTSIMETPTTRFSVPSVHMGCLLRSVPCA